MAQFHIDARCCPVCEEKLCFNNERNQWTLRHGQSPEKPAEFAFFFANDQAIKWHILRVHIRPYGCPICSKRLEKRQLKKHLDQHKGMQRNPEELTKKSSNLGIPELESLAAKFSGRVTKAEMKGLMYWNNKKIYDLLDGTDREYPLASRRFRTDGVYLGLQEVWPQQYPQSLFRHPVSLPTAGSLTAGPSALPVGPHGSTFNHAVPLADPSFESYGNANQYYHTRQDADIGSYPPAPAIPSLQGPRLMLQACGPGPVMQRRISDSNGRECDVSQPVTMVELPTMRNDRSRCFASPTSEELQGLYNLTPEECQTLDQMTWKQRIDLWNLVRSFEMVSINCEYVATEESNLRTRKDLQDETRRVIAKVLDYHYSKNLSKAIRMYQVDIAVEPSFDRTFPQSNFLGMLEQQPNSRIVPLDSFSC
jgi:hypothetical protein